MFALKMNSNPIRNSTALKNHNPLNIYSNLDINRPQQKSNFRPFQNSSNSSKIWPFVLKLGTPNWHFWQNWTDFFFLDLEHCVYRQKRVGIAMHLFLKNVSKKSPVQKCSNIIQLFLQWEKSNTMGQNTVT